MSRSLLGYARQEARGFMLAKDQHMLNQTQVVQAASLAPTRRVRPLPAVVGGLLVVLIPLIFLHWFAGISALPYMWDEDEMYPIVQQIIEEDWSRASALDYQDTKGPSFFWTYAIVGQLCGSSLPDLRWYTLICTTIAAIPVSVLARMAGLRFAQILAVAALFVLLPYNLVLSQLFMSEPSFILGSLAAALTFVWSVDHPSVTIRRFVGPALYSLLLLALIHHRAHAVALAGAVCLLALRGGWRFALPWLVSVCAACLLRLPLFFVWGGLVGEEYQARYGIGLRFDSLVYLAIAALPCTFVFPLAQMERLWLEHRRWRVQPIAWNHSPARAGWSILVWSAIVGAVAGASALPDLPLYFGASAVGGDGNFQGPIATALRPLQDWSPPLYLLTTVAVSALGVMGMTSMLTTAYEKPHSTIGFADSGVVNRSSVALDATIARLAALSLFSGWVLSALSKGDIFDRYLLAYLPLLPLLWVMRLSVRWMSLQAAVLAVLAILLAREWYWVRALAL